MRKAILFLFLISSVLLSVTVACSETVKDISFVGVTDEEAERLIGLIPLKSGDELNAELVSRSIRILFKQKGFKDISADFNPETMTLIFFMDKIYKTGKILISKPPFPSEGMDAVISLFKDKYLDDNLKKSLIERVSEICFDYGYFQPVVKLSEEKKEGVVNISLEIDYKEAYTVDRIIVEGSAKSLKDEAAETLERFSGKVYLSSMVSARVEQIKKRYKKAGYYDFSIELIRWETDDKNLKVDLIFECNEGTAYTVVFNGAENYTDYRLKNVVSLGTVEKIDPLSIDEASDRLKRFYRERGFLFANVSASLSRTEGKGEIVFNIEEGKKVKITGVYFKDNKSIGEKQLKEQMITKPYGAFSFITSSGIYQEDVFETDIEAISYLYQTKGFLDVKVTDDISYNSEKDEMTLIINIDEGVQTHIENIKFTGNNFFSHSELVKNIKLKPLAPLNPAQVEEDRISILAFYNKNGYPYAEASEKIELNEDKTKAFVIFDIVEEKKVRIGKIVVVGNEFTKKELVFRHMNFKTGDIYNAEEILLSQQKLRNLAIFQRVSISTVDFDKKPSEIDIVVNIEEKKAVVLEFGFGYETDNGLKGLFEISHGNLLGDAIRLSLKGEVSPDEKNLSLGFRKPYLFNSDFSGRVDLIYSKLTDDNLDYKSKKFSLVSGVDKNIFDKLKGSVQYEYEILDIFDIKPGAVLSSLDLGKTIIGTASAIALLDLRDDSFNPKKGAYFNIKFDYASKFFGSEIEFIKLNGATGFFMPVFWGNVVGLGIKGGYIHPFEGKNVIPISKRFFLGGRNSVRGFSENSISPSAPDGSKIGGTSYISYSLEYRIPLIEKMWLAFFNDGGNVFLNDYNNIGPYLRSSAGVGLKYETPIGPLSFDYGYKLKRVLSESPYAIHFSIGGTF